MTPRLAVRAAALALLAPIALAGCSGLDGTGDANFVSTGGSITQVDEADRGEPVEISGSTLDEETLDLADLRGEVVVLNVWASWCNPCRDEAPVLRTGSEEIDAEFVGLLFRDENLGRAAAFEREFGIEYPTIVDGDGQVLGLGRFVPREPPSTYVLDTEGRVAAVISGAVTSATTLEDLVADVAAEGTADGTSDG